MRPLIGMVQYSHGLPAGFWRNEYVIGFIGVLLSFHVNVTSGRKLSVDDKGRVLFDAFTALSNMNGEAIGSEYSRLFALAERPLDFEAGLKNGIACGCISIGKTNEYSQPIYEAAKSVAAAQGQPNDLAAIAGNVMYELWFREIAKRFPAST